MPGWMTATTPVPAIVPTKETTPARAARTGVPAAAARSTPRCPAAQGSGGGSNRLSTSAAERPTGSDARAGSDGSDGSDGRAGASAGAAEPGRPSAWR